MTSYFEIINIFEYSLNCNNVKNNNDNGYLKVLFLLSAFIPFMNKNSLSIQLKNHLIKKQCT